MAIQQVTVVVYGQKVSGIQIPVGSTVDFNFTCQDPVTRLPLDLSGGAVIMSLCSLDLQNNPVQPPIISREGDIVSGPDGTVLEQWVAGDTAPTGAPLDPKLYGFDLWFTDAGGNRLQILAYGFIELTPSAGLPDNPITPLPSQDPLAQGPPGPPGTAADSGEIQTLGLANAGGSSVDTYAAGDHVHADRTTAVTAGDYTNPDITVDAYGRITAAASGASGLPPLADVNGAVVVEAEPGGTVSFRRLTEDDIDPGFSISTFAGAGTYAATKEIGDSIVNPSFTATYSALPTSATLNDGTGAVALLTPFASFQYGAGPLPATTYTKTTPNQTVIWTLSATSVGTDAATQQSIWRARAYFGIQTPGTINGAFVTGLPSSQLQAGFAGTYSIGAGNNIKKAFLAFDASLGTPTSFKDGQGFAVPMSLAATVNVTNGFSVTRSFKVYECDNFTNAAFSLVVA